MKKDKNRTTKKGLAVWVLLVTMAVVAAFAVALILPTTDLFKTEFEKNCTEGVKFSDGMSFSCEEITKNDLEDAFLDGAIVKHGNKIYKKGTSEEVAAGKDSQFYCLSAEETWKHIGELRCVVFKYESVGRSGNYYFINEKSNYKTGFVLFMPETGLTWEGMKKIYLEENESRIVGVCGVITLYEGHPQIKLSSGDVTGLGAKEYANINGESLYSYKCDYREGVPGATSGIFSGGYRIVNYDDKYNPYALTPIN